MFYRVKTKHFFVTNEYHGESLVKSLGSACRLNLFYQNLCGISNKKDDLKIYLSDLDIDIDYICICEHFLNKQSISVFNFDNYVLAS